jgi:hypothetical protein
MISRAQNTIETSLPIDIQTYSLNRYIEITLLGNEIPNVFHGKD